MADAQVLARRGFGQTTPPRYLVGVRRLPSFSGSPPSSSTRRGPRCKARTTPTVRISRRSIRPSSSAIRRTRGSGRSRRGGPSLAAVLAGAADPLGPRRVPLHLLLLPWRLLQSVLGRSAGLRRGRAAKKLLAARRRSRSSSRTSTATFSIWRCCSSSSWRYDVWVAMWFPDPATGQTSFGIGVGTIVLAVNLVGLAGYTFGCHSLRHLVGGRVDCLSASPGRTPATGRERVQSCPQRWAWFSLLTVGFSDLYIRLCSMGSGPTGGCSDGRLADPRIRRARHRRRRRGAAGGHRSVGGRRVGRRRLRSRCSARRTRSWPKAASPRRSRTSTIATAGRCTSPTRCAAASTSTTRGWPRSTRRKPPTRVRELEAWGALFDRTADGRILQRNFGGHRYPRLAHVGDRTGLEMIRTLQDHGVHQGITFHMECTVTRLLRTGDRRRRRLWLRPREGPVSALRAKAVVLATGGIGRAYAVTSNSWEYTGDGHSLAYHAGADLIDMEFVQFHPTGMVWPPSVRGILVTEGVRGEGGDPAEPRRPPVHVRPHSRPVLPNQTADDEEEGWRYCQGDKSARRPPGAPHPRPRRAVHRSRDSRGTRQPARRRVPRHRVDQGRACPAARSTSAASCRACITSSRSSPASTSRRSRWRSGRRRTT